MAVMSTVEPKRVTITEVAKRAGVSIQTVSNFVNRKVPVSEETASRVLSAINELGYIPNWTGRSLRSQRSGNIGYFVADPTSRYFGRPYHQIIVAGIAEKARERDYSVLISGVGNNPDVGHFLTRPMGERRVDGAVVSLGGSADQRATYIRHLRETPGPKVILDEPVAGDGIASASIMNYEASQEVVEYLTEKGHQRIAIIIAAVDWGDIEARRSGFLDALREHSLPSLPQPVFRAERGPSGSQTDGGYACALEIFRTRRDVTAIFAAGSEIATGVLRAARDSGRRVPYDLAVVGFEDDFLASLIETSLTTVRVPLFELGLQAAQLLFGYLDTGAFPVPHLRIRASLVMGASA